MKERTGRLLGLIKDSGKTIKVLEEELGFSNGAFKRRDGSMSGNVLNRLEQYFGIIEMVDLPLADDKLDAGDHHLIRRWGNYRPMWADGIHRFRDVYKVKGNDGIQDNGLWKRYNDWAFIGTDRSKERKLINGWGSTGEIEHDDLGEFTHLKNGIKLYSFSKPVVKIKDNV